MRIRIIPFEEKYLNDIRNINVSVSSHPNKPLEEKLLCQYLYIDYYAINSTENCFVAIDDDNNEIVGYVISEPDLNRYSNIILNEYMKEAIKLRKDFEGWLNNEVAMYSEFNNNYSAHLHMDVKPGHQHQGIGTMLIQEEMKHLKQIDARGVMLLCSESNERANNFYQKNGLDIIVKKPGVNIRGKKL